MNEDKLFEKSFGKKVVESKKGDSDLIEKILTKQRIREIKEMVERMTKKKEGYKFHNKREEKQFIDEYLKLRRELEKK